MAWTAPMTAVANAAFTAAQFNTHVRDNLNETAPAKATTAGRLFVTTGSNSIAERDIPTDFVTTQETTTSTSFTDLATSGPAVTATTGVSALAIYSAQMRNNTAGNFCACSPAVSGATTTAAGTTNMLQFEVDSADQTVRMGTVEYFVLTAGSNTWTLKYEVDGGTGTFRWRRLTVIAL